MGPLPPGGDIMKMFFSSPEREPRRCLLRYDVDRVGCGLLGEISIGADDGVENSEKDDDRLVVLEWE